MDSPASKSEAPVPSSETPAVSYCSRKKTFGSGSFATDLRAHFHEFTHASMNEHRTCFRDTFNKMKTFYREKSGAAPKEGEASLALQTKTE